MNIILIERLLEFVEDTVLFTRAAEATLGNDNVLPNAFGLRSALVKHDSKAATAYITSLLNYQGFQQEMMTGSYAEYATDIVDWYFNSKRVFSLSSNLARLLMETNLPDFVPSETHFVANSFAVKLEEPISFGKYGSLYDFLVCTRDPETQVLSVRAYPIDIYDYKRLMPDERKKLLKRAARRDPGFINDFNRHAESIRSDFGQAFGFAINPGDSESYSDIIDKEAPSGDLEDFLTVFQIALGTNLYVQTERKGDGEVHEKVLARRSERGQNVTANADIFTLTTSYVLRGQYSADGSEASGKEVRPHFRRGFWRRPKGYGQDPEAKATEWVRPTLVRLDKVKEGAVPLGSDQKAGPTLKCLHEASANNS